MEIYQIDAFAQDVFRGNPAAVVPLKEWLPDGLLQKIAMENNLAETAYIVAKGEGFLIRWFTPLVEVALCGHATLATGHVLFEHLGYKGDKIIFHTLQSGDLEVTRGGTASDAKVDGGGPSGVRGDRGGVPGVHDGKLTLNFPVGKATLVDAGPFGIAFEGLGIAPRALYNGPYDFMVVLDKQSELEALRPDFRKLATLPGRGIVVTAPGDESDFVSRCFFPQSGIDEDPVTGSAHTMMVPYWAKRLGKNRLSAIQISARRGYLDCELSGDRVFISGQAKTYMKGEIFVTK